MSDAMKRLGYDLLSGVPGPASRREPTARPQPRGDTREEGGGTTEASTPTQRRIDVTLYVPRRLIEALRDYQARLPSGPTRLSLGEIVLGVLAATSDTIRDRYRITTPATSPFGTPLGARRSWRRMGLHDAGQLRLKLPVESLAAVDAVAAELGISRSALVSEAIEAAMDARLLD